MNRVAEYTEHQITLFGKSIKLVGVEGDSYFEALNDFAEPDILNILTNSISDDDWVVDVGANIGYLSLAMSILCPKGKVFAFEPAQTTNNLLRKNVSGNKIKNIKVSNIGLSDSKSNAKLTYDLSNSSGAFVNEGVTADEPGGHGSETITLSRLDDEYKTMGITKCALLKVDVEGHETQFLKGATKFIKKYKPQAIIEANHWCLNVFSRTSLPDFIELTYKHFPYIFAFYEGNYLDLSDEEARYKFYYENAVNNIYTNIYCGFDRSDMIIKLNSAFGALNATRQLSSKNQALSSENQALKAQSYALQNSRPQRIASRINKITGR